MKHNMPLVEVIIQLHDIARIVEQQIGIGDLSEDIRRCADRVNTLIKEKT
jgi:hypothetical protein